MSNTSLAVNGGPWKMALVIMAQASTGMGDGYCRLFARVAEPESTLTASFENKTSQLISSAGVIYILTADNQAISIARISVVRIFSFVSFKAITAPNRHVVDLGPNACRHLQGYRRPSQAQCCLLCRSQTDAW